VATYPKLSTVVFLKEIALSLTAAVGHAIAAQTGEVDGGLETAACPGLARRIAGLVGHCTNTKTTPTILQHLWHKRHAVQCNLYCARLAPAECWLAPLILDRDLTRVTLDCIAGAAVGAVRVMRNDVRWQQPFGGNSPPLLNDLPGIP
jgi:hypothetical protein